MGDVPQSRSGHASAVEGDLMIIWGGIGESEIFNDMFVF